MQQRTVVGLGGMLEQPVLGHKKEQPAPGHKKEQQAHILAEQEHKMELEDRPELGRMREQGGRQELGHMKEQRGRRELVLGRTLVGIRGGWGKVWGSLRIRE